MIQVRTVIALAFAVSAFGYVAVMTAQGRQVEWIAVGALLACAAVPFIAGFAHRPSSLNPIVEGELKEKVKHIGLAMATGHVVVPVPPPANPRADQFWTGVFGLGIGALFLYLGDSLVVHETPAGTALGIFVICTSSLRLLILLFSWVRGVRA